MITFEKFLNESTNSEGGFEEALKNIDSFLKARDIEEFNKIDDANDLDDFLLDKANLNVLYKLIGRTKTLFGFAQFVIEKRKE